MITAAVRKTQSEQPRNRVWRSIEGLFHSAWGQVASALCALFGIRLYTELLSKTEFGYVVMVMGGVAFIDGIFILAFNQTLLSLCGQTLGRARQNTIAAGMAIRLAKLIAKIGCSLFAISLAVPAATHFGWTTTCLIALFTLYLVEELLKISMISPLIANGEYFRYSMWSAAEAVTVLAVTALLLKVLGGKVIVYLLGLFVGRLLCSTLFFGIYYKFRYFSSVNMQPAKELESKAFRYGWPISTMAPLGWASTYLDRFMLIAVSGPAQTAVYAATASLVSRPYALTSSVLTNFFRPKLYSTQTGVIDRKRQWQINLRWAATSFVVGTLGVLAFLLCGRWLPSLLLAKGYRENATFLLVVLAFSQTFLIITHAVDNTVLAYGASSTLLKSQVALAVVTSVLIPMGAVYGGERGAALGRLGAEIVKCACTFVVAYRLILFRVERDEISSVPEPVPVLTGSE